MTLLSIGATGSAGARAPAACGDAKSRSDLDTKCSANDGASCAMLATCFAKRVGVGPDRSKVVSLRTRACESGVASTCLDAATAYLGGDGVAQNLEKSVALITKGCDSDDSEACAALSGTYRQGLVGVVSADKAKAASLDEKAFKLRSSGCDAGRGSSCSDLAIGYRKGRGVAADLAKAAEADRKACVLNDPTGCWNSFVALKQGTGVTKDNAAADAQVTKACDVGHAEACVVIAEAHETGERSFAKDASRSTLTYRRACDLFEWDADADARDSALRGCVNLAMHVDRGLGTMKDHARAVRIAEQVCSRGETGPCTFVKGKILGAPPPAAVHPPEAKSANGQCKFASVDDAAAAEQNGFSCGGWRCLDACLAKRHFRGSCVDVPTEQFDACSRASDACVAECKTKK